VTFASQENPVTDALKSLFLLDPSVVFLNHGSFGACPAPVFETYQRWQRELERQPVDFMARRSEGLLAEARAALAGYLGCATEELVFFQNPTTAMNLVARSLPLRPGDEILTTDHEYGAMDKMWEFACQKAGASYVRRPIPLPLTDHAAFAEHFWAGVTPRTRAIFISHITSPTALIFPVAEICRRAGAAGLLSLVDGAHAPGQIAVDLRALGADVYTGTCHKWLSAPKGSAFLYAGAAAQPWLEPLIVSFGWGEPYATPAARFVGHNTWQGTRDLSAFLSVPAAIAFQAQHDWEAQRRRCHALAEETRRRINALTGEEPLSPDGPTWFAQMASMRMPAGAGEKLKALYERYRIEIPLIEWQGRTYLRVSFQAYNAPADADALVAALGELLG
jgi:isopenicillin-N epimerase